MASLARSRTRAPRLRPPHTSRCRCSPIPIPIPSGSCVLFLVSRLPYTVSRFPYTVLAPPGSRCPRRLARTHCIHATCPVDEHARATAGTSLRRRWCMYVCMHVVVFNCPDGSNIRIRLAFSLRFRAFPASPLYQGARSSLIFPPCSVLCCYERVLSAPGIRYPGCSKHRRFGY